MILFNVQGGGLIPFKIDVSVVGDVTIAIWLGDHNMGDRIHARPSFAYAFHTAFVSEGLARVTMQQLDIFDSSVLPATPAAQSSFFMDVTFDELDVSSGAMYASSNYLSLTLQICHTTLICWAHISIAESNVCHVFRDQECVDLADVAWMRQKWGELMTRTHGEFVPPPFKCVRLSYIIEKNYQMSDPFA